MERRRLAKSDPNKCVSRVKKRSAGHAKALPTTRLALVAVTLLFIGVLVALTARLDSRPKPVLPNSLSRGVQVPRTLRVRSPGVSDANRRNATGGDDDADDSAESDQCSPKRWLNGTDFPGMDLSAGYIASASSQTDCCIACLRCVFV